ncbi:WhiB family transcriptional regulator [Kitasatospora sp. McL0602]|uniref:WhiB family transcriptional regulator n=1 Tax=Kitasatospora sp. McL0602 TaxID=3439530 RepID=UPI003F89A668
MTTTTITPARHRSLGDHTWQDRSVCLPTEHNPVDPEIFFPEPDETEAIAAAKSLCGQCPVSQNCLDAALESGDTDGIRGGLTEEERAPLHKKSARRLEYSRVNATIAGRDVHLTGAEREAVVLAAYHHGLSAERLAWLLKFSEEHAQKLYREIRRAIRNRDRQQAAGNATALPGTGAEHLGRDDFGTAA